MWRRLTTHWGTRNCPNAAQKRTKLDFEIFLRELAASHDYAKTRKRNVVDRRAMRANG